MNLPVGYYLQHGKYQLSHVVGQGGFGITYKGVLFTEVKGPLGTIKTNVPISIKEYFFKDYCYRNADTSTVNVHSETGKLLFNKFKEKLIKEARILSDVHHPYIVNVLDVFEENNTAYIVMEYIDGHSLKYLLERDGVFPEEKVLTYIHQIGKALQFVHEKNILHLDIKPSNILVDKNNRARLIDFGVSKRYDIEDKETSTTMLTLSKGFASIEQYDNEGTLIFSPRPDIYSLGATMYNLLTGKIPTESILRATRPLKRPSEINPNISQKTEDVVLKAMQITPEDRYLSVQEMLNALDLPTLTEETKENNYTESNFTGDDESTVFYSSHHTVKKVEDDEHTLINNIPDFSPNGKKKKKKRVLLISLICIFALIGSSVALLLGHDRLTSKQLDMPLVAQDEQKKKDELPDQQVTENNISNSVVKEEDQNARPVEINRQETNTGTSNSQERASDNSNRPLVENQVEQPLETLIQPTEQEINARYSGLLSSGKIKMQANDFEGANKDFLEAHSIKSTEEVKALINDSYLKIQNKLVADRLALYEEKSVFGRLRIVRKKDTRKYGAIDDDGIERIKCAYVDAEKINNDQYAFVQENNLFDIYNSNGDLLKSSVGTY